MVQGTLEEEETKENDEFKDYIAKWEADELEEGQTNPIVEQESDYFTLDVTAMGKVSLATADDPYYLTQGVEKYIPQVVFLDKNGDVVETVDNTNKRSNTFGSEFMDDIRDNKLKINDDRKVVINLNKLQGQITNVLLFIDSTETTGDFSRAQYRLLVEDTNQSVEVKVLKDQLAAAQGGEEDQQQDEEEGKADNKTKILAGRLFLTGERWIYESFNIVY